MMARASLILLDTTGELSATCLHHRQKEQPCWQVNPQRTLRELLYGIPERRLNPMGRYWLNPHDPYTFDSRAAKIAAGLAEEQSVREKFWDNSSRGWIETGAMVISVIEPENRRNLGFLASVFASDPISYFRYAMRRLPPGNHRLRAFRYAKPGLEDIKSASEVLENLNTQIKFLLSEPFADALSKDEIHFGDCRRVPQTISIIVQLATLGVNNRFLNVVLEQILAELQDPQFDGPVPVMIVIDEFLAYQKSDAIKTALTTLRKFNCTMAICVNNLGGLQEVYGKEASESFQNEAGAVLWYSAKSLTGSEHLSKLLGDTEVFHSTKSIKLSGKDDVTENWNTERRPLMAPFEVRQNLGPRDAICFLQDAYNKTTGEKLGRPILLKKRPYFETSLAKLAKANPFARFK